MAVLTEVVWSRRVAVQRHSPGRDHHHVNMTPVTITRQHTRKVAVKIAESDVTRSVIQQRRRGSNVEYEDLDARSLYATRTTPVDS